MRFAFGKPTLAVPAHPPVSGGLWFSGGFAPPPSCRPGFACPAGSFPASSSFLQARRDVRFLSSRQPSGPSEITLMMLGLLLLSQLLAPGAPCAWLWWPAPNCSSSSSARGKMHLGTWAAGAQLLQTKTGAKRMLDSAFHQQVSCAI